MPQVQLECPSGKQVFTSVKHVTVSTYLTITLSCSNLPSPSTHNLTGVELKQVLNTFTDIQLSISQNGVCRGF